MIFLHDLDRPPAEHPSGGVDLLRGNAHAELDRLRRSAVLQTELAVDSDEHSFRAAGRKAFRNAVDKVKPAILEPVMDVEVVAPVECSGDIMGDLNSRRGRMQGMEMRGKNQVIKAQVPMSEMLDYQSKLNSITAARGSYHMEFSHYDPVPGQIAQKIIEQARAEGRIRAEEEE